MSEAPTGEATTTTETTETAPEVTDWQAEAAKWKALADQTDKRAKRHADEAKANAAAAKELEQFRQASMSDQEKAVATARAEARAEALREVGAERVADAVRVAAAGRSVDVDALLEGLDRSRFLDDEGQPDVNAIAAWVDRVAPKPTENAPTGFPDLGQGARGSSAALNGDPLLASLKSTLNIR